MRERVYFYYFIIFVKSNQGSNADLMKTNLNQSIVTNLIFNLVNTLLMIDNSPDCDPNRKLHYRKKMEQNL